MIKNILKKSSHFNNYVKKSDVEDVFVAGMKALKTEIYPMFDEAIEIDEDKLNTSYLVSFARAVGKRKGKDILTRYKEITADVIDQEANIIKLIRSLPDVVPTGRTTARNIAIIALASEVLSFASFIPDLIYVGITKKEDIAYGEYTMKNIKNFTGEFYKVTVYLANVQNNVSGIDKINNSFIISEGNNSSNNTVIEKEAGSAFIHIPLNLLIGSVYHVRKFIVDIDIRKFQVLTKKKALIENRLLELKRKGGDNPDIKRAIDTYVEEIESVEYQLQKIAENYA